MTFSDFFLRSSSTAVISIAAIALLTSSNAIFGHDGDHDSHAPGERVADPAVLPSGEPVLTGYGEFAFEAVAGFGQFPEGEKLGPTHGGVAVDAKGLIYVSTNGDKSIAVFRENGEFLRSFAPEARGLHSLQIVEESGRQYLYGAQLSPPRKEATPRAVKLDLEGNIVGEISEESTGGIPGGFKGLTSVAVAPDGNVFLATGYGSNRIHKFDAAGELIHSFGEKGDGDKMFRTCHGLAIDLRFDEPRLLVCDREKRRLVHFDLEGNWIGEHATDLRRPCAVSFHGDYCAVAELAARVVILDKAGHKVSVLGDNPDQEQWANYKVAPEDQQLGVFTAPHGLSFDARGNLYVQDWNATGRITKLTRLESTD